MKISIIIVIFMLSNILGFHINNNKIKSFPKVSYTKIHDISYKSPIYLKRRRPYTFTVFKQIKTYIANSIDNYINETYAMASLPLSYTFPVLYNKTLSN